MAIEPCIGQETDVDCYWPLQCGLIRDDVESFLFLSPVTWLSQMWQINFAAKPWPVCTRSIAPWEEMNLGNL